MCAKDLTARCAGFWYIVTEDELHLVAENGRVGQGVDGERPRRRVESVQQSIHEENDERRISSQDEALNFGMRRSQRFCRGRMSRNRAGLQAQVKPVRQPAAQSACGKIATAVAPSQRTDDGGLGGDAVRRNWAGLSNHTLANSDLLRLSATTSSRVTGKLQCTMGVPEAPTAQAVYPTSSSIMQCMTLIPHTPHGSFKAAQAANLDR